MANYEGTIRKYKRIYEQKSKEIKLVFIDVESIPVVPGASERVPRAPQHRKIRKIHFFKKIKKSI